MAERVAGANKKGQITEFIVGTGEDPVELRELLDKQGYDQSIEAAENKLVRERINEELERMRQD